MAASTMACEPARVRAWLACCLAGWLAGWLPACLPAYFHIVTRCCGSAWGVHLSESCSFSATDAVLKRL